MAPITTKTTPVQRMGDTFSPRKIIAAKVAKTKLKPVSGQRKLISLLDIKISRQAKNNASKKTPPRMYGLVAPALTTRAISAPLTFLTSPISDMPFFRSTTPVDSKVSPIRRINKSLSIKVRSQIAVANQFDAQFARQCFHARADEGLELMFKVVQRGVGVKL